MFKKLLVYFLGISLLGVILFSILIIVTNKRTFNQVLTDKESQYTQEVEKTLKEAEEEIQGEIDKITGGFYSLVEEIKKNENTIARSLRQVNTIKAGGRIFQLPTVAGKSNEIMSRFPDIQFIFLVGQSGKVEYGYPITPLGYLYPVQLLKQFKEKGGFNTFAIDMANADTANQDEHISITFGIQLKTEGQLNNKYITSKINFSEPLYELSLINEYLRKDVPGDDLLTSVFLMNKNGYIFSHYNDGFLLKNIKDIKKRDIPPQVRHDTQNQESNYIEMTSSIPNTDLVIGIMKQKKGIFFNELEKIQKTSYGYLWGIALFCLIVGGILTYLSSRRIVKPIRRLSERAEAAEKGDYESKLELKTGDELEHLSEAMHLFIRNTKNHLDNLQDELNLAKRVQKNFLPENIPSFESLEIVFEMKLPEHVGGDYLDLIPLTDSKLAIIMADASGKSFYGAFHITMIRALTHSQILHLDKNNPSPDQFLTEMAKNVHYNKIDYERHGFDMVTFLFGILDTEKGEFIFSSAGHPPAFLYNASKDKVISMENVGLPLGVGPLEKHVYTTGTERVGKNDILLFYSDGLIEQQNSNEEGFGEERVKQLLINQNNLPISELKELIFKEFSAFKGEDVEQSDDISVIFLRI